VLESVFGKFKQIEGEQARSGLTGMLLSIPAMVSVTTEDVLYHAMESASTRDVQEWCHTHLGLSVQAKRRRAFNCPELTEQKWDELVGVT